MSIGDLSAIGAAACWSVSVILMRVSGLQIPPLPLTFFKNCVALLCLAALMLLLGEDWMPELARGEYLKLVISALLGISFADTMIAAALNRLGASLNALADCVYTPAMACVGFLMFQEVPSVWEILGGSLVVSGVFVGAALTAEVKTPRDLWMGFVLAAGAHIIMAVGILMVRDIFRETSLVWVTGFRFLVASLGLLGWAAVRYPKSMRVELFGGFFRPDTWRTMIPMALFGPFAATLFWVAGFKHLEVGRAAIFNQLSTVFIILMAYVFLEERFTKRKALGSVLALGGAVLVAAHSPSATQEAPGDGSFEGGVVADEAVADVGPIFDDVVSATERGEFFDQLKQQFVDDACLLDAGESKVEALEAVGEALVIEAELSHHGGVQVAHVDGVLGDVVTEVVRLAVAHARLDAGAGHPDREAARVVVATAIGAVPLALSGDAATEFAAPDDEGVFE